jgi:hypothetical protein
MKRSKRILQALGTLLFASLMLLDTSAKADVTCRDSESAMNTLECENSNEKGTRLSIRHIPAWGPNAGYVLVDMCDAKRTPDENKIAILQLNKNEPPTETPARCVRRYCSDAVHEFGVSIAATPIPIGFDFFLGVALAFKHSQFEIQCRTLHGTEETSP